MPPKSAAASKQKAPELLPESPFTRKPLKPPEPGSVPACPPPSRGLPRLPPVSLEAVLPDWNDNLADEKWDNGDGTPFVDTSFETDQLPAHIKALTKEWARAMDVLNPVVVNLSDTMNQEQDKKDKKKGGEKDDKAAKANKAGGGKKKEDPLAFLLAAERDVDDSGKTVPRVVVAGSSDAVVPGGRPLVRPLKRMWSAAQREIIESLGAQGADAALPLQIPLEPDGDEADPVFAGVIKLLAMLADSLVPAGSPYLWQNIYPQNAEGKPVYNPGGKYVVRLWAGGKWRRVVIDDRLPLNHDKQHALVSTVEARELWPVLLSKAVYKLYHLSGARALHPDLLASNSVLASFVSYAVHALTGAIPGMLPTESAEESVLEEMREGGTPVEDFDRMRVDATPWLTIQAGRPGKKKVFWKRKKRSQHKKLRVFFDEVDASLKEQTARIHHVAHLLTQPKEKVFLACYVEDLPQPHQDPAKAARAMDADRPATPSLVDDQAPSAQPRAATTTKPSGPLRRAVICPLLAVATTHRLSHYRSFQQAQPDGNEGPPPFPRVLTGFSTRPPVASVLRDEQGAPLHKRVKGEPSVYWHRIDESWEATSVLLAHRPCFLHFHTPAPLPHRAHHQWYWPIGQPDSTPVPPPVPPPTYVFVEATQQQPAKLVVGLLKSHPAPTQDGLPEDPCPWSHELRAYLQEVRLPTGDSPPQPASPGGEEEEQWARSEGMVEEKGDGGHWGDLPPRALEVHKQPMPAAAGSASPLESARVHLPLTGPRSFTSTSLTLAPAPPGQLGRLYRLALHAPLGASVFFASDARVQVGDAASLLKAATASPSTSGQPNRGSVVEETGTYPAAPAGQQRVLFRRVVKPEPFSGPGHTMLHLCIPSPDAAPGVRLWTVDNDSGEATCHPLLHTGFMKWGVNSLGYTVLATYYSATSDLSPGPWRLLLFSDARVPAPLGKQEVTNVVRYGGAYTANKYHRLFRDVLQATQMPVSLQLSCSRADAYLRLRVSDERTGALVADVRGRRRVAYHTLGLDALPGPDNVKKYVVEATLDAEAMAVDGPEVDSPRPYYFVQTGAQTEPASWDLEWSLDLTCEALVSLTHDTGDLDRFAKVRQAWEAAQPGRAEKAKKVREMWLKSKAEGVTYTATQRVEMLTGLLEINTETARAEKRRAMVSPTVQLVRPEGEEEGGEEGAAGEVALFEAEDLSLRLSKQKEMMGASALRLQQEAAARKASLEKMQEDFKAKVAEMEAHRKELLAAKEAVWAKREAIRAAQVARAAEEARKAAEEEAAAAALLAPEDKKKKKK